MFTAMTNTQIPPKIAIVIPSYNSAATLRETLHSCVSQTFGDWVAIVTIDGDDCELERQVICDIGDPRIRLHPSGERLGQFRAFNRSLLAAYATGAAWVKFLCADDVLHTDALQRFLEVGEQACGLVYGYYDCIDDTGQTLSSPDLTNIRTTVMSGDRFLLMSLRECNPVGGPSSVMLRRDVIEHCGIFDDLLNYSGEAVLWYRAFRSFNVGIIGERPVLKYRFHSNSVTGRGFLSTARFSNPLDLARGVAARQTPLSRSWWAAQQLIAGIAAANLQTAGALVRRREFQAASSAAIATCIRLPIHLWPFAMTKLTLRIARQTVGLDPWRGPLSPTQRPVAPRVLDGGI